MGVLCPYHIILPNLEVDGLTEVGRTKLCCFIVKCAFKLALTTEMMIVILASFRRCVIIGNSYKISC